jgi:hypothetical protein
MNDSSTLKSILLLAANPKGTVSLRLQEEEREIKERLRLAGYGKVPINSTGATRTRDIQQAMLDFKPQIVHFTGHGAGKDGLAFEDGTGQPKLVDSDALANLFKLFSSRLECVVLNACYSQVQAEAIAQHIDYVIGMSQAIGDRAAIEFSVGFYTALGAGEAIEFAYELGCNAIQLEGIPEHLTPVLFGKKKDRTVSPNLQSVSFESTTPNIRHPIPQSPGLRLTDLKTAAREFQVRFLTLPPVQKFFYEDDAQPDNALLERGTPHPYLEPTSINWRTGLSQLIGTVPILIATTRTPFWRRWVLMTITGVALGAFALYFGGILVGLTQWLVLRKLIARPNKWIFATGVGWFFGHILGVLILSNATDYSMGSILRVVFGIPLMFAVLGLAQWFVLKGRFSKAQWWIFATTIGGAIGVILSVGVVIFFAILLSKLLNVKPGFENEVILILGIVGFISGVAMFGAVTGTAMVWLLKHSNSTRKGNEIERSL